MINHTFELKLQENCKHEGGKRPNKVSQERFATLHKRALKRSFIAGQISEPLELEKCHS